MFSAISAITTLTCSGDALAPTRWIWLLFFTAVPLLSVFFGGTPDTYHTAGLEQGTATSSSTRPGTTSHSGVAQFQRQRVQQRHSTQRLLACSGFIGHPTSVHGR